MTVDDDGVDAVPGDPQETPQPEATTQHSDVGHALGGLNDSIHAPGRTDGPAAVTRSQQGLRNILQAMKASKAVADTARVTTPSEPDTPNEPDKQRPSSAATLPPPWTLYDHFPPVHFENTLGPSAYIAESFVDDIGDSAKLYIVPWGINVYDRTKSVAFARPVWFVAGRVHDFSGGGDGGGFDHGIFPVRCEIDVARP